MPSREPPTKSAKTSISSIPTGRLHGTDYFWQPQQQWDNEAVLFFHNEKIRHKAQLFYPPSFINPRHHRDNASVTRFVLYHTTGETEETKQLMGCCEIQHFHGHFNRAYLFTHISPILPEELRQDCRDRLISYCIFVEITDIVRIPHLVNSLDHRQWTAMTPRLIHKGNRKVAEFIGVGFEEFSKESWRKTPIAKRHEIQLMHLIRITKSS